MSLLVSVLAACGKPYRPDICTQVNTRVLNCIPTNASKKEYDLIIGGATIGMACMSNRDFSDGKKRARKILEGLNKVVNLKELDLEF